MGELFRVAKVDGSKLIVSRTAPGRGAWLCNNSAECLDAAVAKRQFQKAFRTKLDAAVLERLEIPTGLVG